MNVQKDRGKVSDSGELRRRAETALRGLEASDADKLSAQGIRSLIHELEIHQIELEMQNEELRRAQEELGAARDEYADLYDFAPIGYLTVGENGQILEANLTAAELLGTQRGVLLGQSLSRFVAPEGQDVYYQHRHAVLAANQPQTCEVTMVGRGGTPFDVRMQSMGIANKEGTVTKWRTVINDVTEHKQAEQALRLRNRAMEAAANGIILTDWNQPSNPIIYCNPAFEKITGYTLDEVLGRNARFLQGDDGEQEGLKEVRAAIEQGHECHVVVRNYRKDGTLFWNELAISPVRDKKGQVAHFVGIQSDITERKRAEEALRRERDFAESLIETAQVIVLVLDPKGRIVRFNRFYGTAFRLSPEEVRGQDSFNTFLPEQDRERIQQVFQKAVSDIRTISQVNPIITHDGQQRIIEWYDKTLKDTDGNLIGVLAIGHDITEHKEQESQLVQAQKMELVGQLTGGIAHDFNNLLAIVLGNLDFLSTELEKKNILGLYELLNDAHSAAREGAELTHRLLALSRRQALQPKQIGLDKVVQTLKKFLRRILGGPFRVVRQFL